MIVNTYLSIPHFIVFCFTVRNLHVAKRAERAARERSAAKIADLEAVEHAEHVSCQKCKNVELPPAYENVEVETPQLNQINQTELAKTEKGPLVDPMPLHASQTGLSVQDDEGRVVGT